MKGSLLVDKQPLIFFITYSTNKITLLPFDEKNYFLENCALINFLPVNRNQLRNYNIRWYLKFFHPAAHFDPIEKVYGRLNERVCDCNTAHINTSGVNVDDVRNAVIYSLT